MLRMAALHGKGGSIQTAQCSSNAVVTCWYHRALLRKWSALRLSTG